MMTGDTKPKHVDTVFFEWAAITCLRNASNFNIIEGILESLIGEKFTIECLLEKVPRSRRVDLIVKDKSNNRILVEIVNEREADYIEREIFPVPQKEIEGIDCEEISRSISIFILFFNLRKGNDYFYSGTDQLQGKRIGETLSVSNRFTKTLYNIGNATSEFHVIHLENFSKPDNEVLSNTDQWIYLFKNYSIPASFDEPGISAARHIFDVDKLDPEERRKYGRFAVNFWREKDIMETAYRYGFQKGLREAQVKSFKKVGATEEQIAFGLSLKLDEVRNILKKS